MARHMLPFQDKPWLRRTSLALGIAVVSVLVTVVALRILAITPLGRGLVETRIERAMPAGQSLRIDGLKGDLLGRLRIDTIDVADSEGIWLEVENAEIDWAPFALLRRHIHIKTLAASTVNVLREPVLETSDSQSAPGSSPERRYTIGTLNINTLSVDEALTGRADTFQLSAALDTNITYGDITLKLVPTSAEGDSIDGALAWSDTQPLTGALQATGPQDGLLKDVLGILPDGAVEITLNGAGDRTNWTATAKLLVATEDYLDLAFEGTELERRVSGTLDSTAFTALSSIAQRLGGPVNIQAALNEDAGELTAEIIAPNLRADASTPYQNGAASLGEAPILVSLHSPRPSPLIGVERFEAGTLSANGEVTQTPAGWVFDGSMEADRAMVTDIRARAITGPVRASYAPEANTLTIDTTLTATGLSGLPETLSESVGRTLRLAGTAELDLDDSKATVSPLNIDTAGGVITARGDIPFDLEGLALTGSANLKRAVAGIRPRNTRWSARSETGDIFALTLDGAVTLTDAPASLANWTAEEFNLAARGSINTDGEVRVSRLRLQNAAMSLSSTINYSGNMLNGDINLALTGGEAGSIAFDSMTGRATLSGTRDNLTFDTNLAAPGLVVSGEHVSEARLQANGTYTDGTVSTPVSFRAIWQDNPISLKANAQYANGLWRLDALEGALSDLSVRGQISGQGADPQSLQANLALDGALELGALAPSANGTLVLTEGTANIDMAVTDIGFGNVRLETLNLKGSGTRSAFNGTAQTIGGIELSGAMRPFDLTSGIQADLDTLTAALSPNGMLFENPVETRAPLIFARTETGQTVTGELALFGGLARIDASNGEAGLSVSLDASGLNAEKLSPLISVPPIMGRLDVSADLTDEDNKLAGTARLELAELKRTNLDIGRVDALFNLVLADERLTLSGNVQDREDDLMLSVEAETRVITSTAPISFALQTNQPFTARLNGGGPVAPIWTLVGPPDTRLEGDFIINATIDGTPDNPQPVGKFDMSDGVLEEGILGLRLQQVALTADLDRNGIEVRNVMANGAESGELSGSGRYGFDGTSAVNIQLNQLQALRRSDASAVLSGTLAVTGADEGSRISGDIEINRAEIDIERLPSGGYVTLDVRFRDADDTQDAAPEPSLPVSLDIALRAPRRVFVNGNGLNTEWALDAQIGGTASEPSLRGTANIIRGDVDLIGRNFQFSESSVRFTGDPANPRLNINADRSAGGLTAGFDIRGTAQDPDFALSSSPALPDDEILSRVLFGRSPTELSAFEAAQLATAIASLTGNGGFDLIGPVKDVLGVDRLDFGVSETGAPTVGAGKYIANNVYLELRSSTRGAPGVSVEWSPRSNIEIVTDIEPEEAPRFAIQWKRDFDLNPPEAPQPENTANQDETKDKSATKN